jgi:hypothetical protein
LQSPLIAAAPIIAAHLASFATLSYKGAPRVLSVEAIELLRIRQRRNGSMLAQCRGD